IADKDDYNIGDTAEILITSPFQGETEALITVERGSVLDIQRVTLTNNSFVYELPIIEAFAPNVFVTVTLIKGVDDNNPVAAFRYGQAQLSVDASRKVIDMAITTDVATAAPQETVTYTIETLDYQGQPVQAEIGVSLTDLAALSIAPPNVQPMLPFFYGDQGLSVRSASGLTINTDQLTQQTLDTVKGGGGGGGGGFGVVEVREEFEDTPYWNAAVITDENGTASFDVMLPDNLTTWRLDAKAITQAVDGNMLVGEETFDLLSTKPVLIRPVTPRFFVVGDEVYLAAVVNNNSDEDIDVAIRMDNTDGLTYIGDDAGDWREQRTSIAAGERGRVTWQVRVDDVDAVQPTFAVLSSDEQYSDGSISPVSLDADGTLPVYRYEVPETAGTGGVLRSADDRVESIVLPQRFAVDAATLTIKLDQSLAAPSLAALDYLNDYPHQSIEQVVSRFLPNIMTFRALNDLQLTDDTLASSLNLAVSAGLQKLFAEQKSDGGWGWFVQDDSSPLTTAYALIGLIEARDQGFAVNELVIVDAQGFLLANLTNDGRTATTWQLNRRVFMNYALARSGMVDVSRLARLFDSRDDLSLYAKAFLAEALYISNGDFADSRVNALVNDLVNAASISATGARWQETERDFWNWNTDIRTTAIVTGVLTRIMPESDLLPNAVRYLMAQRTADAWETTQETAWSVMALTDWMRVSGELNPTYSYSLNLNDREQLAGFASPATVLDTETVIVDIVDLLRDEANLLTFERGAGEGNLYYSAHLEAYLPVTEVQPLDRGILISREYTEEDGETPVTEAQIGEVIQVRLTIVVPENRHYVIIEDPLPAGAEAINPNLSTEQQTGTRPGLDSANPLSRGWGWWWFSNIEFRDENVTLYSTFLPAGTYEYVYSIRPGIEGVFNVIPATGQESYFPEVYGRSAGTQFTVLPE
ncbi:MAG: alpha-2-macroglobulin family protein, partial [Aggregatilineales bacterium]